MSGVFGHWLTKYQLPRALTKAELIQKHSSSYNCLTRHLGAAPPDPQH